MRAILLSLTLLGLTFALPAAAKSVSCALELPDLRKVAVGYGENLYLAKANAVEQCVILRDADYQRRHNSYPSEAEYTDLIDQCQELSCQ